jgi:hypothetical protein
VCSSNWFYNYWGYYWGGFWRNPFFNGIARAGCGHWRTSLAFSFMAMVAYLVTAILVSLLRFHGLYTIGYPSNLGWR